MADNHAVRSRRDVLKCLKVLADELPNRWMVGTIVVTPNP
jgi:hypothetical protein